MKYYLAFSAFLWAVTLHAQAQDTTAWRYAELVGTSVPLSSRLIVEVDFGQKTKMFPGQDRVLVDEAGKPIKFNSMVDALNHMGAHGWEFVQAYVVGEGGQRVYRWLLRTRSGAAPPVRVDK